MQHTAALLAVALTAAPPATAPESWVNEPFPPRPDASSSLSDMVSVDGSVWAVGGLYTPPGSPSEVRTQVFQRGDEGWREVPTPDVGGLIGSAATSPQDAWAIGHPIKSPASSSIHWDGKAWTEVPITVPGANAAYAHDITTAGDDAWIVGTAPLTNDRTVSFTQRWQNGAWHDVAVPPAMSESTLEAVGGTAPNDVWAIGGTGPEGMRPFAAHWDGSTWKPVTVPPLEGVEASLTIEDVTALAADDVWVAAVDNSARFNPFFLHWDGTGWNQVSTKGVREVGQFVFAEGALWNLGDTPRRYDGTSWQPVEGPAEGKPTTGVELPSDRLLVSGSDGEIAEQPFVSIHHG